ncbi:MAG: hypothetical protein ACI9KE_002402 [Polyangiales bacterium]|jgi:hypothetical protein
MSIEPAPQTPAARAAQRQLDAYNAHDAGAFAACFHPEVRLFDLKSGELRGEPGRDALRATYGGVFERCPKLHAEVTSRAVVGNTAFDREVVTGLRDHTVHAMAIYEVDDEELITRVWFVIDEASP